MFPPINPFTLEDNMKSLAILTASAVGITAISILFFALQACANGSCGECSTNAGTDGWYVIDPDGSKRCAQCDGRV